MDKLKKHKPQTTESKTNLNKKLNINIKPIGKRQDKGISIGGRGKPSMVANRSVNELNILVIARSLASQASPETQSSNRIRRNKTANAVTISMNTNAAEQ